MFCLVMRGMAATPINLSKLTQCHAPAFSPLIPFERRLIVFGYQPASRFNLGTIMTVGGGAMGIAARLLSH
jgi:hypothetical protein